MKSTKSYATDTSPMFADARTAWVLTDGTKGMEVQSMGLARRMHLDITQIELKPPKLVRNFPRLAGFLPLPGAIRKAAATGWPDLIITTGRRMAGLSILTRARSGGLSRTIHIQDAKLPPTFFDLVIVPSHDKLAAITCWSRQARSIRLIRQSSLMRRQACPNPCGG